MSMRRPWLAESLILLALAGVATALFWWTDLDRRVSALFYQPVSPGSAWPGAEQPFWGALHHLTPWLAGALGAAGLAMIVAGWRRPGGRLLAAQGIFVVMGLALGPGLLVNAVFKDQWHRPRPRQTVALGGDHQYVPPLAIGPYGKSFPCGHASVGFAFAVFYYVLRRRRPAAAWSCLAAALAAGLTIGAARVAAGAHFLSDVLWAGFLVWGTLIVLHYGVLRMPALEAAAERPGARDVRVPRALPVAAVAVTGAVLVLLVLAATPFEQKFETGWGPPPGARPAPPPPGSTPGPQGRWRIDLLFEVGSARVIFEPVSSPPAGVVAVRGDFDGFGFPGARLDAGCSGADAGGRVRCAVRPRGLFTDLEGRLVVRIAAASAATVDIEVADGVLTLESSGGRPLPRITCRTRPDAVRFRGVGRDEVIVAPR